jgi:hypothetical protein
MRNLVAVMKIEGLPVIEVDESEEITVAVRADDLLEGDTANPKQHPIALRRQDDVDDARVTKSETLVRRDKQWFRYAAPNKRLFKEPRLTDVCESGSPGGEPCQRPCPRDAIAVWQRSKEASP